MDMITSAVPAARFEHIVVNAVGGEVLVYDRASNQIHHLNESSATVWRLCDGERTVADIARAAGSTDEWHGSRWRSSPWPACSMRRSPPHGVAARCLAANC